MATKTRQFSVYLGNRSGFIRHLVNCRDSESAVIISLAIHHGYSVMGVNEIDNGVENSPLTERTDF